MSATAAAKHRLVYRKDLQQLARPMHRSQGEATGDKTTDIVPMFAKRLLRTQRLIALVAAMLVTLLLIAVFAREKWEQRFHQQQKRRQVDRGEVGYAPGAANEWYVHSYDFGTAQNYNRNALLTSLYSAGPPLIGALPLCNADGSFTETGGPAQKDYRSTTETFDTRLISFDGSNYLDKVRVEVFVANTMGSYNKPFNDIPLWQDSAPFTVTCSNANSNVPSIVETAEANPYEVNGYTPTKFGKGALKSITEDWWRTFNAAIPTHWTSYPPAELRFGPGARVSRFHQNVITYSGTAAPAIRHSLAAYGPDAVYYQCHGDMGR